MTQKTVALSNAVCKALARGMDDNTPRPNHGNDPDFIIGQITTGMKWKNGVAISARTFTQDDQTAATLLTTIFIRAIVREARVAPHGTLIRTLRRQLNTIRRLCGRPPTSIVDDLATLDDSAGSDVAQLVAAPVLLGRGVGHAGRGCR